MERDRDIFQITYSRVRAGEEGVEDSTEDSTEVAGAVAILKGGLAVPPGVRNIFPFGFGFSTFGASATSKSKTITL